MPTPSQLVAANKIFVDREIPQKLFEDAVFNIPIDRSSVCVFYGAGGEGKTALCRELIRKINPKVDPSYTLLRFAELDLHARSKEDPELLLVWIRNSFVKSGLELPAFDLALALTWEATRAEQPFPKLLNPWMGRITEGAEAGVDQGANVVSDWLKSDSAIDLLGDLADEIPFGPLIKKGGKWAINASKKAYLYRTRNHLKELFNDDKELKKPYELLALLPKMLASDITYYICAHREERPVLFIDEYERVFDEAGAGSRWRENPFDSNIRTILHYAKGLLIVFFSREKISWLHELNADERLDERLKITHYLLGGLTDRDADEFLRAIPIEDAAIRQAIIAGARETPTFDALVYPLMLDLQVEHWRRLTASDSSILPELFNVAAASFVERRREIVTRVLRDYGVPLQTTLERLSVTRRFDRVAFHHVVQTFGTGLPVDQFDQIAELSFVTKSEDGFLTFHNAIAETIRETLSAEKRRTSTDALFTHFEARATVNSPLEVRDATVAALIEASFLRLAQGPAGYVEWLEGLGKPIRDAARFPSVAALWREALTGIETSLGPEHPDTAKCLNNLAVTIRAQGDFTGARPLHERALAIREKALGPEHPATAQSLNNLAALLRNQGDFVRAKLLFERALAIREKALGPEHRDTAQSLNNLAGLRWAQGDLAGARPLFERALAIREKTLGPEHRDTAQTLNDLAGLLRDRGEVVGIRPFDEKTWTSGGKALGDEDSQMAPSFNIFADPPRVDGALARALPLYERALVIREKTLGPEHPETAQSLDNLANLRAAQGDYSAARGLQERALAIREKALGPEHPETAQSLNNLANVLRAQADLAAARPLQERALAIREKALGPEHPETAQSLNNLAALHWDQGDLVGARALFERALAIREKALGPEHFATAQSLDNLANLRAAQGDLSAAQPFQERALAIREKALGPEHPATAQSLNSLANILRAQGDLAAAQPLYERALAVREKVLGPEHRDTAQTLVDLAGLLRAKGDRVDVWPTHAGAPNRNEKALSVDSRVTERVEKNLVSRTLQVILSILRGRDL